MQLTLFAPKLSKVQLDDAINDTKRILAEKVAAFDDLRDEIADLRRQLDALTQVAKRVGVETEPESATHRWVEMGRSEAVLQVITEAERPITNGEILNELVERGRFGDTSNYVGAALSYLREKNSVMPIARGTWILREWTLTHPEFIRGATTTEDR